MDDAELVRQLRNMDEYEPLGHDGWKAADRIEALIAERDAARNAALEEAAHIVDAFLANTPCYVRVDALRGDCSPSAAIRALKSPAPPHMNKLLDIHLCLHCGGRAVANLSVPQPYLYCERCDVMTAGHSTIYEAIDTWNSINAPGPHPSNHARDTGCMP